MMKRKDDCFTSINPSKNFQLAAEYKLGCIKREKTDLDRWLTERYCLYLDKNDSLYSYDIHHLEWEIQSVSLEHLALDYRIGNLHISSPPHLCHYSKGVKVLAWGAVKIDKTKR